MIQLKKINKSPYLIIIILLFCGCSKPSKKSNKQNSLNYLETENMVLIPEGPFQMGSDNKTDTKSNEKPIHNVYLKAYYIDKFEVTNRQYKKFISETGYPAPYIKDKKWANDFNWDNNTYPKNMADYPVVLISWKDANEYARWAQKRLPTEAEWEKASRGGLINKNYPFGNKISFNQASFNKGYVRGKKLYSAGSYPPNGYGLNDMSGNVWEWCQDWYSDQYYQISPEKNPVGPDNGTYKVFRGGSWMSDRKYLRCAFRGKNSPDYKSPSLGFRCVISKEPKK